jgi:hypothetical protein
MSHRIRDYQPREFDRGGAGDFLVSKLIITMG